MTYGQTDTMHGCSSGSGPTSGPESFAIPHPSIPSTAITIAAMSPRLTSHSRRAIRSFSSGVMGGGCIGPRSYYGGRT